MDVETAKYYYDNNIKIGARSSLYKDLVDSTKHVPGKLFPKQRLWHIINQTSKIPLCKMCSNEVKWDDAQPFEKQSYRVFCSVKCSRQDADVINKKIATELDRYGEGRVSIVEKTKLTNNERYGSDYAIQNENYKDKQKQTNIKKYGIENVIQYPQFIQKRIDTNMERYGCVAPAQNPEVQKKIRSTVDDRYGVPYYHLTQIDEESLSLLNDKDWLYHQHITNQLKFSDISKLLNVHQATVLKYIKKHGLETCYYSFSSKEKQLSEFIHQSYDGEVILNSRNIISPLEIDVFIPSLRLAVEFNGIFWHSELNGKDRNYHIRKLQLLSKQNIQLIHIFENEWDYSKHIVQSRILNALGKSQIIHARRCVGRELDLETAKLFFDNNHLQGFHGASYYYGLYHNDELVCAAAYSKPRYSSYDYELIRMCNLCNISVVGGASKLQSMFIKQHNPKTIISYCDKRYGLGTVYKAMNYTFSHDSSPSYRYFKRNDTSKLLSRISFQKHKLKDKLEHFDDSLSEWQNMINNGYDRIWDCGNSVWVWKS